jgi:hypothetical protein
MADVILPAGTRLYKGFGNRTTGCRSLLKSTRTFFATQSARIARSYSNTNTACPFIAKRSLRLFLLTHPNVKRIFPELSRETVAGLRFVLGTNVTRVQQVNAYQRITGRKAPKRYLTRPMNRGERLSLTNVNSDVFTRLSTEYLIKNGYDGFYAPQKRTGFHGGMFPAEIMLCDAGRTLSRPGVEHAPVLSRVSVVRELPQLFIKYCRKNRTLLRVYRNLFVPELGGGMGVKLYLEARGKPAPKKVIDTKDFDFTFAVPKRLSYREASRRALTMKTIMYKHVTGFVSWLNRTYTRTNARIIVNDFVPDIKLIPATGKIVYYVSQFRIQFPGQPKPMDFVDSTLAYVPGSSREDLHPVYSRMYGLPIERLKKLYDSVLTVLAGSFVYAGIKPRNPLTGKNPEKGQKNVSRLGALQNLAPKNVKLVRNLIRRIKNRDVSGATRNAVKIIKNIKSK